MNTMKLRNPFLVVVTIASLLFVPACNVHHGINSTQDESLVKSFTKNLSDAAAQYKVMMKQLDDSKFPKTYDPKTNKFETSNSGWWCSGFYPGTLLYLYEQTRDKALYDEALRILKPLEKEQYNKTTHDLGFMMFCSFGNANRIEPKPEYRDILINSAKSLSSRFDSTVGCIRSWGAINDKKNFLVIIDNMMNLELLFWATKATGDSSFYKIAVTHADNTMKNHFRPDFSSYHVLEYDPLTGVVRKKRTAQGAADASAWARGQGWGLYGYTVMYRETKDKKYLDQANHIAEFILNHPNLPADKVPYWDFNAPGIPNAYRDASAGSLIASALLELSQYVDKKQSTNYINVAKTILNTLSSTDFKAAGGTNGGFLLKHSVGNIPGKSEVDVPLTYADYYFVEAMIRFRELANKAVAGM